MHLVWPARSLSPPGPACAGLASRSSHARRRRDTTLGAASATRAARLQGAQSSATLRSATFGCWNSLRARKGAGQGGAPGEATGHGLGADLAQRRRCDCRQGIPQRTAAQQGCVLPAHAVPQLQVQVGEVWQAARQPAAHGSGVQIGCIHVLVVQRRRGQALLGKVDLHAAVEAVDCEERWEGARGEGARGGVEAWGRACKRSGRLTVGGTHIPPRLAHRRHRGAQRPEVEQGEDGQQARLGEVVVVGGGGGAAACEHGCRLVCVLHGSRVCLSELVGCCWDALVQR